jgi:LmbE family N-acetylglucosaminyl deacetylase
MKKIIVIAVHPDDETLGSGGTLLKHKEDGDEIHWLICTTIEKTDSNFEVREKEIKKVDKIYGFKTINNLRLKTTRVDEYSNHRLVKLISDIFNEIRPNIIYLPFKGDIHSDHREIFNAAYSCTKSFRFPFVEKIYVMETLSETEFSPVDGEKNFTPNVFVDISNFIDKKIEIMRIYKSEIGEHPFPRSEKNIRALATYRGASAGFNYAESFILIKEKIR